MKKIINSKKYDTETAHDCGSWWNGYSRSDFSFLEKTLYRKRTGEYFLHCEGGAQTQYASRSGNMYGFGEKIVPMDYADARKWAEANLDVKEFEEEFGFVPEDDGQTVVNIKISEIVARLGELKAEEKGMNLAEYVEKLLKQ